MRLLYKNKETNAIDTLVYCELTGISKTELVFTNNTKEKLKNLTITGYIEFTTDENEVFRTILHEATGGYDINNYVYTIETERYYRYPLVVLYNIFKMDMKGRNIILTTNTHNIHTTTCKINNKYIRVKNLMMFDQYSCDDIRLGENDQKILNKRKLINTITAMGCKCIHLIHYYNSSLVICDNDLDAIDGVLTLVTNIKDMTLDGTYDASLLKVINTRLGAAFDTINFVHEDEDIVTEITEKQLIGDYK